jgi:hypothetical protein
MTVAIVYDAFATATTATATAAEVFIGVFAAIITAHDMELAAGTNRQVTLRGGRVVELE